MSDDPIIPGEVFYRAGDISYNEDRPSITIDVMNTGDRPVQVGSHFHFAETNAALNFNRDAARGCHLSVPAGTSVRFEPGAKCRVELVPFVGSRIVAGFNGAVRGPLDA